MKPRFIRQLWLPTIAASACANTVAPPTAADIVAELSRRSGVAEARLNAALADCDVDQQSIYFCAFRDLVAADLELEHVLADKIQHMPDCQSALKTKAAALISARDSGCARAAAEDYGGGSMEPTARALCAAGATQDIAKQVRRMSGCSDE